jgi:hypothetical protein
VPLIDLIAAITANEVAAGVLTVSGGLLAILATLRYVKRTEDDTVDGLRDRVRELAAEVEQCRVESREARRERALLHLQIDSLMRAIRAHGIEIPADYPAP